MVKFLQLGEELARKVKQILGFVPTLINPRYVTGLDCELLKDLKKDHKLVITLEDGILDGGFGTNIASYYGKTNMKVINYGLKKEFIDRYDVNEILKENRLTPEQIIEDIENNL